MRQEFLGWTTEGQLHLDLPRLNCLGEDLNGILSSFVEGGAFPVSLGVLMQDRSDNQKRILHALSDSGFAESEPQDGGACLWRLTSEGMLKIAYSWVLNASYRVLDVRADLALEERTQWELMLMLEERGWEWQPLTGKRRRSSAFDYVSGGPLVWYTSGPVACALYLRVLLEAPRLFAAGIAAIPHGKNKAYYKQLLAGVQPTGARRPRALNVDTLQDDMALPELPDGEPAPHDADVQHLRQFPHRSGEFSDEEEEAEWVRALEDALEEGSTASEPSPPNEEATSAAAPCPPEHHPAPVEQHCAAPGEPRAAEAGGSAATARRAAGGSLPGPAPEAAVPVPACPVGASEAALVQPILSASLVAEPSAPEVVLRSGAWGCFRITPKTRSGFGGFQARCPWHRKNASTDCKKFISLSGPSRLHQLECIRRLLTWCLSYQRFDRQRDHVRFTPSLQQALRTTELLPQTIREGPACRPHSRKTSVL